jgi:Tripartite tricarboxylate transporter TctB family
VSPNRIAAAAVIAVAAVLFALTFGFEKLPAGLAGVAVLLFVAGPASEPQTRIPAMVYYTAGSLLAFMALVPVAGMLGAMFVFLLGLGYLWGERRAWLLLVVSAAVMAAIWGVFVRGFAIQLPQGLWS